MYIFILFFRLVECTNICSAVPLAIVARSIKENEVREKLFVLGFYVEQQLG